MNVNDSVVSQDGALRVTLTAFDPRTGQGRLKIEELKAERGRFYVTVTYGEAGQTRIDYKTYDLKKASELPFATNRNDAIKGDRNRPGSCGLIRLACAQESFSFRRRSAGLSLADSCPNPGIRSPAH